MSAVDAAEANSRKPVPTDAILTDEGSARYGAAVETWGETVSRAWGRICRTLVGQGVSIACAPAKP